MTKKGDSTDSKITKIAWATDFSKESRFCLPYIKFFTETLDTENHALYVLPKFSDWIIETAFLTDDELFATIEKTRRKSLANINNYSKRSGVPFKATVIEGIASEEIIKYAGENDIDIVFAGRRGISEIEQILIGSTTSRLIRNTDIPVFVAPKNRRAVKIEKILCPIDFNEFSMRELEFAISLARQLNAQLYAVHISEFFNYRVPVFKRDRLIEKINKKITNIAKDHNYKIENIIYDEGEPGQKIIEIANKNKMDLITMATHQRTGIEKFFLGSITEKVLMYSSIPVLILPPDDND
jgi:nucleotide-binding universal stress UspA family protein